jgi:pimeloyl-ACP methyl ester carboxylesterase
MTESNNYQSVVARQTCRLAVRGLDYCVNEWGDEDAPLVFYLHGWADTGSTFQFVVDALGPGWRVLAPDWRGFGRSSHGDGPYWFPDYLADLNEILRHYSPDEPVRLVGHSMGGNIASLYAGVMPERVEAIVNIEGFGLTDSNPADAPGRYRAWFDAMDGGVSFSIYSDFENLAERIRSRNPCLSKSQADFVARQWASLKDGAVHLRADPMHKLPNAVLYRRAEAEACWREITASVLLVSGDSSPFAKEIGDPASLPFPDSQLCTIPDAGHMIHFDAPELLAAQIRQFLI